MKDGITQLCSEIPDPLYPSWEKKTIFVKSGEIKDLVVFRRLIKHETFRKDAVVNFIQKCGLLASSMKISREYHKEACAANCDSAGLKQLFEQDYQLVMDCFIEEFGFNLDSVYRELDSEGIVFDPFCTGLSTVKEETHKIKETRKRFLLRDEIDNFPEGGTRDLR